MAYRVAINGFGRIGRLVLRAAKESGRTDLDFVAINDLAPAEDLAFSYQYDSVHGNVAGDVVAKSDRISVNGDDFLVFAERDPSKLPWGDLDIDIVFECTGRFRDAESAGAHLKAGAKKVLISAPGKSDIAKTIVYGVNHDILTADDLIVSNASCTTNCLAPVAKVLDDLVGITRGYCTTVHAYTADQRLVDGLHSDPRRARAAALSMIPTTTGAAAAVGKVLPNLAGKLDGSAIRVPTPNVSLVDFTIDTGREKTTVEAVNQAFIDAANSGPMAGVLDATDKPLVSIDLNHNPASSTVDLASTDVVDGHMVRVLSWYDNEWGFSNRMLDTGVLMASLK